MRKDARWKIARCFMGYAKPRWRVTFCDDYVANFATCKKAMDFVFTSMTEGR